MTKKITLGIFFLLMNGLAFAQNNVGHLTIFSEDGDKFFLILNGEKQNDIAQTNLRIEDLNQPYYNAKIIFENETLSEISKNNLSLTDVDDIYSDVTYKIKRDKNNKSKMKMNFFSMVPVQQHYSAPANVHVMHYGQPRTVQTTTTTTAGTNMSVGMNVGLNVGMNVGMNVNIVEPIGMISETTTTTTAYNSNTGLRDRGCNRKFAMLPGDFNSALATVKNQKFDDTRLKTAKQITSANCLSAAQIVKIAEVFGFEESKLNFAKFAYEHCTERENYFKLNNIFSFSSSVDELTAYIESQN